MKSTETRLFVRSIAFRKVIKSGPLWGKSSGDRRDSPTKGQWWQLSMKWRHGQCKENSNDLIDTIWLTLLLAKRLSLSPSPHRPPPPPPPHPPPTTPPTTKKRKNRCGVSWYSNWPWFIMTMMRSSFFYINLPAVRQSFLVSVLLY